jgi:AcrR family transcriptional regulator
VARRLTASAERFATSFEEVRMDDIAQVSGIPRATLYYYFDGKDDILAFLLQAMLEDLRAKLSTASKGRGTIKHRLIELVRLQLAQIDGNPAAAQLLLTNLGRAGKLPDLAASVQDVLLAPINDLLSEAIVTGAIPGRELTHTTSALFGAVIVVGLRSIVLEGHVDSEGLAEQLVDLFWTGLANQPVVPAPRRNRTLPPKKPGSDSGSTPTVS